MDVERAIRDTKYGLQVPFNIRPKLQSVQITLYANSVHALTAVFYLLSLTVGVALFLAKLAQVQPA